MKYKEIERKFLVAGEQYRTQAESVEAILQGYLCKDDGKTVRVRLYGERGFLTIKGKPESGKLERFEWETPISADDARILLSECSGSIIHKTRYLVRYGKHMVEVDEFHGDNEGLVVAEIELEYENEPYEKPEWLGREVTDDSRYYNAELSRNPYKNWK